MKKSKLVLSSLLGGIGIGLTAGGYLCSLPFDRRLLLVIAVFLGFVFSAIACKVVPRD